MSNKIRKSIDIPEKELKKLQIQAVFKGVSLKVFLESIIIDSVVKHKSIEVIANEYNKD